MILDVELIGDELDSWLGKFYTTTYVDADETELPGAWVPVIINHTLGRTQLVMRNPVTGDIVQPTQVQCQCVDDWPIEGDDKHDVEFLTND